METKNKKPIRIRLAEKLIQDQQELEHLAVQISLGKVEMKDEFKKAKTDLKNSIHELKVELKQELKETEETIIKDLEEIEKQITEDVTYTKESFIAQKKNIAKAINKAKKSIKKSPKVIKTSQLFNAISQKSKLQLGLLEKNVLGKKVELTEGYQKNMQVATEKFEAFTSKIKEEKEETSKKLGKFKKEVAQSYKHLKKAFKAL